MKFASLKVPFKKDENNRVFKYKGRTIQDHSGKIIKHDNKNFYYELKKNLKQKGIILNTHDYYLRRNFKPNIEIHVTHATKTTNEESYLLFPDTYLINKNNNKEFMLKNYKKIFTWNNEYLENKKFIKVNTPKEINYNKFLFKNKKRKQFVILASNKIYKKKNKRDLYYERIKIVKWFSKNANNLLDIYGMDWDLPMVKSGIIGRLIRKFSKLNILKYNSPDSYKGIVKDKKKCLKNYKYCFCFENSDINGYIGDLIWDCFMSGTIPIYLGSPYYENYIPKNTTINFRKFNNMKKLIKYLDNLDKKQYFKIISNMKKFLQTDKKKKYGLKYNLNKIVSEIN